MLMDIEGTTTSISFVHEVLFPYASAHLESYVRENIHLPEVLEQIKAVKATVLEEFDDVIDDQAAIDQLLTWIKEDRKHPALKNLQGFLWKSGYETGQYRGHLYEDVLPAWERWQAQGIGLGIYSSGSVAAQKLLFGYSEKGDLQPYLSHYFDTKIGHKREVSSYHNIQKSLSIPVENILFLSDVVQELEAAKAAGFQILHLLRPGTIAQRGYQAVAHFDLIDLG
ncbi:MAG: acireductone synthase [Bacteroidota bacterium]